jgi:hypothetical protein
MFRSLGMGGAGEWRLGWPSFRCCRCPGTLRMAHADSSQLTHSRPPADVVVADPLLRLLHRDGSSGDRPAGSGAIQEGGTVSGGTHALLVLGHWSGWGWDPAAQRGPACPTCCHSSRLPCMTGPSRPRAATPPILVQPCLILASCPAAPIFPPHSAYAVTLLSWTPLVGTNRRRRCLRRCGRWRQVRRERRGAAMVQLACSSSVPVTAICVSCGIQMLIRAVSTRYCLPACLRLPTDSVLLP